MKSEQDLTEQSPSQRQLFVDSSKCDDKHLESANGGVIPAIVAAVGYGITAITDSVRESSTVDRLEAKLEKDRALADTNRSLEKNVEMRNDLRDQISQLTPEQQKSLYDQA